MVAKTKRVDAALTTISPTAEEAGGASTTQTGPQLTQPARLDTMIDIETLGTEKDALILSVGAVLFDPFAPAGTFLADWHEPIALEDQSGRRASVETVMWWLGQSDAGRAMTQLRKDRVPVSLSELANELTLFAQGKLNAYFLRTLNLETGRFWANAPTFDLTILRDAFTTRGIKCPFSYREERCFRTLYQEFGNLVLDDEVEVDGTKHDALYDAKRQAAKVQQIYAALYAEKIR